MCLTCWRTWAMPGSREDLAAPSLPPCTLAGIRQRSSSSGAKFRRSLVLIPWKSQPTAFFLSFSLGREDSRVLWCGLHAPGQEFSQEIPPSSPLLLLLQASKKLPLEIYFLFKFRCLHYLEFGFINYLHLVHIKKS